MTKETYKILIEFDGKQIRVKASVPDAIICFGMLHLATLELQERLKGPEDDQMIIPIGKGPLPKIN